MRRRGAGFALLWLQQSPPQQDWKFTFSHPHTGRKLVFLSVKDRLPGRTAWVKGLAFGVLLLLINDALLRLPIMNLAIGHPVDVMLVQSLEAWLISPIMGILIAQIARATLHAPPGRGSGGRSIDEGPNPEDRSGTLESGR